MFAQALKGDHVEVGAFADYFRLDRTEPNLNYAGVGGRLAFNLRPTVQIEGEMAYDFELPARDLRSNFSVLGIYLEGRASRSVQPGGTLGAPQFSYV